MSTLLEIARLSKLSGWKKAVRSTSRSTWATLWRCGSSEMYFERRTTKFQFPQIHCSCCSAKITLESSKLLSIFRRYGLKFSREREIGIWAHSTSSRMLAIHRFVRDTIFVRSELYFKWVSMGSFQRGSSSTSKLSVQRNFVVVNQ